MNNPKPKRTPPSSTAGSEAKKVTKPFDPKEASNRIKRLTIDIENLAHRQVLTTANKTSILEDAAEIRELVEQIVEYGFKPVPKKKSRFIESTDESDGQGDDDGQRMSVDGPTVNPSDRPSAPITASISTQTDGLDEPVTLRQLRRELSKLKQTTEPERSASQPMHSQSDPNWGLPVNRPAVIISGVDPRIKSYSDVLSQFKSGVDFTTKDFGPLRTKPLAQNKVRVEFNSESQRDIVINELSATTTIKAESARRIRPLIILKGIPVEILKEDIVGVIARQNPSLGIKSTDDAKLRFARNNRSPTLYNAVIEVYPSVRKAIFEHQDARIHVSHLRVRAAGYIAYTQCYKCLQFGHTSAKCTSELSVCSHCASDGHKYAECPSKADPSKAKCRNCANTTQKGIALKPAEVCHSATSESECPRILSLIRHLRSITDYGITESTNNNVLPQHRFERRMSTQRPRTDSTVSTGSRRSKRRPSTTTSTVNRPPPSITGPSNSEKPAQTRM